MFESLFFGNIFSGKNSAKLTLLELIETLEDAKKILEAQPSASEMETVIQVGFKGGLDVAIAKIRLKIEGLGEGSNGN